MMKMKDFFSNHQEFAIVVTAALAGCSGPTIHGDHANKISTAQTHIAEGGVMQAGPVGTPMPKPSPGGPIRRGDPKPKPAPTTTNVFHR